MADVLTWIAGGAAALVAFAVWIARMARKAAAARQLQKDLDNARDTQDRLDRGRAAVRNGRGDNPADRLRSNDGRWE